MACEKEKETEVKQMNDAVAFLLRRKFPKSQGERAAVDEGLFCSDIIRANTCSPREITAMARAASLKNQHYYPAVSAFFEAIARASEHFNNQTKGL